MRILPLFRHSIAVAALIVLSACSQATPLPQASADAQSDDGPLDARRVTLPPVDPLPAPQLPTNADGKAVWALDGDTARFGVPGAGAMLTLSCTAGRLLITRPIAAELGAGALFAIEGQHRIVRIPVDATAVPGQRGYVWQGSLDGADADTDVFTGPFTGTLPGGGLIKVSAGEPPRDVVKRCHNAKP
ncbi:hypothetical protein [Novosphingobium sp.]|uniref:hypothetical protein n=1 Tax=Novosphingobium sp. TaxID=1874826 RepID=UPI00333FBB91